MEEWFVQRRVAEDAEFLFNEFEVGEELGGVDGNEFSTDLSSMMISFSTKRSIR